MEEGVLLEADVDEHGLEAVLDVLDPPLEDAADDIAVAFALDRIFFEDAVFEKRDAAFEPLAIDNELVAGLARGQTDHAFDTFGHGKNFWVKLGKHWG